MSTPTRIYRYIVVFEPAEEGGYVVRIPALPGVVTQGETLDEARSVARDAINGYLESLAKDGETGPIEEIREPLREVIEVAVA